MKYTPIPRPNKQHGAATLVTALILLLAITLVTFSAARVGVTEQRTSTNDMRAKSAQDVANAGVEYGISYLTKNQALVSDYTSVNGWGNAASGVVWGFCTSQTAVPCGDGTTNIYNAAGPGFIRWLYFTLPATNNRLVQPSSVYGYALHYLSPCVIPCDVGTVPSANPTVIVVAEATSRNNADLLAGRAISQQVVRGVSGLGRVPQAPIIAAGAVNLSGTMDIWGNATGFLVPPLVGGTANPVTTSAPATGGADSVISYTFPAPTLPPAPNYQRTSTLSVTAGLTATTTITTGKPLSVWTSSTVSAGGTPTTCVPFYPSSNTVITGRATGSACGGHPVKDIGVNDEQDFITSASRNAERVSAYLANGSTCYEPFPGSIVPLTTPNPAGCPVPAGSLFEYTFGVPSDRSDEIKNQSTILSNCSSIETFPAGRYWIVGDCTISGGTTIVGAIAKPFVVIVEGNLSIGSSNTEIYGLIYVRGAGRTVTMNGGLFQGALVSESPINRANGNNKMVYDAQVLLNASGLTGGFRPLSGGWADEM